LAAEMVDMIIYQADYNANSKSVTTGNTMLETVINMVR
jgi:flagellar hook protein FlgE